MMKYRTSLIPYPVCLTYVLFTYEETENEMCVENLRRSINHITTNEEMQEEFMNYIRSPSQAAITILRPEEVIPGRPGSINKDNEKCRTDLLPHIIVSQKIDVNGDILIYINRMIHEIAHCVIDVFDAVLKVKINTDTSEFFAYLMGSVGVSCY